MGVPQPDYGARHVAALVLIVEPGRQRRIDPAVVATTLGLTPPLIFCVMTRVLVAGRRKAALLKSRSREPLDDQAQLVVCRSVVVKREDARPVSAGPMQTCPIDSVRLSTLACLNAVLRQAAGRPNRLAALPGEA